jgi:hemolysin III
LRSRDLCRAAWVPDIMASAVTPRPDADQSAAGEAIRVDTSSLGKDAVGWWASPEPRTWPEVKWDYDRAEFLADGAVHALGVTLSVAGVLSLVVQASGRSPLAQTAAVLIYGAGLLTVLCLSATYNLWPVSSAKWLLRRFDHAAIYLLIASTYTPFLIHVTDPACSQLLVGIWTTACAGMVLKLACPGRFDRLAILLYLGLGWSGLIVYERVVASLPPATVWLLAVGGVLYSAGVIFHLWETLRFHNAIWHAFVLAAAACHFCAVCSLSG